jgi:hypothetical protein
VTELAGIENPEEQGRVIQVRVDRWNALEPPGLTHPNLTGYSAARAEVIRNLRALADFLEARPEMPISAGATFNLYGFAEGTSDQRRAQVDYASTLLGAPITDRTALGGNSSTGVSFGNVRYEFVATSRESEEATENVVSRRRVGRGPASEGRRR